MLPSFRLFQPSAADLRGLDASEVKRQNGLNIFFLAHAPTIEFGTAREAQTAPLHQQSIKYTSDQKSAKRSFH
jgi:hypothetical protein